MEWDQIAKRWDEMAKRLRNDKATGARMSGARRYNDRVAMGRAQTSAPYAASDGVSRTTLAKGEGRERGLTPEQ